MTVGGQPAIYIENSNTSGKERYIFMLLHETDLLSLIYERQPKFDAIYECMVTSFRFGTTQASISAAHGCLSFKAKPYLNSH
jgi:hypothetical protein